MPPVLPAPLQTPPNTVVIPQANPSVFVVPPVPVSSPTGQQVQPQRDDQFLSYQQSLQRLASQSSNTPAPSNQSQGNTNNPFQNYQNELGRLTGTQQNNPNGNGNQTQGRSIMSLPSLVQLVSSPLSAWALRYPAGTVATSTIGRWVRLGGTRIAPGVGLGFALFDVGSDWYRYLTTNTRQHQPFSEERRQAEQQRDGLYNNALTNSICTGIGALAGAIICGIFSLGIGSGVGAMIGAGFGNIVGNLLRGNSTSGIGGALVRFLTGRG